MEYLRQYNGDGIFFRIERDGKWMSVCLSDMNEDERRAFLDKYDKENLYRVINHLCDCVRQYV